MASNTSRRNFIRKTAALTGGAFAAAGTARAAPLPGPADQPGARPHHRGDRVRHALEVRGASQAPPHRCLQEPAELVGLEHDAAAAPARHHHAERADRTSAITPARRTSIRARTAS